MFTPDGDTHAGIGMAYRIRLSLCVKRCTAPQPKGISVCVWPKGLRLEGALWAWAVA